ncbi:hypothetical protein OUZ56_010841 [Daphnia magna]|uniref:Uncharacterized protein n=1 Tax=Daphnia magna TaxID=35525 RepID=A0ABQ9YYN6_9CRUS|nr:hypothetical protein OUZ56_010841 [Daphnia magna]
MDQNTQVFCSFISFLRQSLVLSYLSGKGIQIPDGTCALLEAIATTNGLVNGLGWPSLWPIFSLNGEDVVSPQFSFQPPLTVCFHSPLVFLLQCAQASHRIKLLEEAEVARM